MQTQKSDVPLIEQWLTLRKADLQDRTAPPVEGRFIKSIFQNAY